MFNTHCCIRKLYTYAHQTHTHRERKQQILRLKIKKLNLTHIHYNDLMICGFYKSRISFTMTRYVYLDKVYFCNFTI